MKSMGSIPSTPPLFPHLTQLRTKAILPEDHETKMAADFNFPNWNFTHGPRAKKR